MAMQNLQVFQGFKKRLGLGQFNFGTHTLGCALFTSALTVDAGVDEVLADLNGEVAAANGYATGGVALTGVTWAEFTFTDPGTQEVTYHMRLNADNTVFTAAGGNIVARYYVVYNATATGSPLIGYGLLEEANGGTDITITNTNTGTINWNDQNGIIEL